MEMLPFIMKRQYNLPGRIFLMVLNPAQALYIHNKIQSSRQAQRFFLLMWQEIRHLQVSLIQDIVRLVVILGVLVPRIRISP